jgi:hypothetical protein
MYLKLYWIIKFEVAAANEARLHAQVWQSGVSSNKACTLDSPDPTDVPTSSPTGAPAAESLHMPPPPLVVLSDLLFSPNAGCGACASWLFVLSLKNQIGFATGKSALSSTRKMPPKAIEFGSSCKKAPAQTTEKGILKYLSRMTTEALLDRSSEAILDILVRSTIRLSDTSKKACHSVAWPNCTAELSTSTASSPQQKYPRKQAAVKGSRNLFSSEEVKTLEHASRSVPESTSPIPAMLAWFSVPWNIQAGWATITTPSRPRMQLAELAAVGHSLVSAASRMLVKSGSVLRSTTDVGNCSIPTPHTVSAMLQLANAAQMKIRRQSSGRRLYSLR